MENIVALSYLAKMGGDEQSGFSGIKLINLELSHIKTGHSYSWAPTRNFECGGRLRAQKCEGLKRMNVEHRTCSNLGKPEINLACIESVETTHKIHITAQKMFSIKDFFSKCDQIRRKRQFGHIYWRNPEWKTSFFVHCILYTHSVWGRIHFQQIGPQGFNYVLIPFGLIGRILAKVQREKATLLLVTPVWKTQAWFPKLLKMSIQNPILSFSYQGLLTNPKERFIHYYKTNP